MKKIYGALLSRAGRTNWAAHECGVGVEHIHVATGLPAEEKPADFIAINPAGTMPVYQEGEFVMTESWAIDLYLARKYRPGLMGADLEEEGKVYQWTLFAATDLEKAAHECLNNSGFDEAHPLDSEKFKDASNGFRRMLARVDEALQGREYLVGNRFTLADLHVACLIAFPVLSSIPRDDFKNIEPWLQRCTRRPAFARSLPPELLLMVQGQETQKVDIPPAKATGT